jgi:hypothetical protein
MTDKKTIKKSNNLFATLWSDFFPERRDVQEDGIHAKLNYQNIADTQRRSMSLLMLLIILFSISFVLFIYSLSINETMVSAHDFNNYTTYMETIEHEILDKRNPDKFGEIEEKMFEDNTSMYWSVFFTRFLLVRILIGITLGIILTFLIRIYFRVRHDRAINIHKEEALSTLQYVARGEWRMAYDKENETYRDVPYIIRNGKLVLTTKQFLKTLPINSLFKAPSDQCKKRRKSEDSNIELLQALTQMNSKLSEIEDELHDIRKQGE